MTPLYLDISSVRDHAFMINLILYQEPGRALFPQLVYFMLA